jgi:hypothetical protein
LRKLAGALGVEVGDFFRESVPTIKVEASPPSFNEWLATLHPEEAFRELEALKRVMDGGRPEVIFPEGVDPATTVEQLAEHLAEYARSELRRSVSSRI